MALPLSTTVAQHGVALSVAMMAASVLATKHLHTPAGPSHRSS